MDVPPVAPYEEESQAAIFSTRPVNFDCWVVSYYISRFRVPIA